MNIQDIFDRVINQRYYDTSCTFSTMCHALHWAWSWGEISEDEYLLAREQIWEYLRPFSCAYLKKALEKAGLPNNIEARTAIYRDWANRPTLIKEVHTDVQATFDKVIASGWYSEANTPYMCPALNVCRRSNILTHEEVLAAKNEIDHYLGDYLTLEIALKRNSLPRGIKDRLAIYQDWANRPILRMEAV